MRTDKKIFWLNFIALSFVIVAVSAVAFIVMYDYNAKESERESVSVLQPSGSAWNTTESSTSIPTVMVVLPTTTESENNTETQNTSESLSASDGESEGTTRDTSATEPETTTKPPVTTEPQSTTPEIPSEPATTNAPQSTTESPTTTAEGTVLKHTTVEPSYFDDALFIGDSRTVGIQLYGVIKGADYFCNTGMSIYSLRKAQIAIEGLGEIGISDLLKSKSYNKVYVMLGINELGYSFNKTLNKFGELIEEIRTTQPNAVIYIQANLHVTKARSDKDEYVNNANLDRYNKAISAYADNKTIFYIDPNEYFDDAEGNLSTEYCSDASHMRSKYYKEWSKWICTQVYVAE